MRTSGGYLNGVPVNTSTTNFALTGIGQAPLAALNPGLITTVAGNGSMSTTLSGPGGLSTDGLGDVSLADTASNTVRKLFFSTNPQRSITIGNGTAGYVEGSSAVAEFNAPQGVAFAGNFDLYIADTGNNVVRMQDQATRLVSTFAGTGAVGYSGDHGPALSATFNGITSVAVAANGNVYIADRDNNVIRMVVATSGNVLTYVGGATQLCSTAASALGDGCPATSATLLSPSFVTLDSTGAIYIIDSGNQVIRRVDPITNIISTVAGVAGVSCVLSPEGGLATNTPLCNPTALAVDAAGNLYVSSGNKIQRVESATGAIWPMAGTGNAGYSGDGGGAGTAMLNNVQGLALDPAGNLYVSDYGNAVVREISTGAPPLNFADTNVGSSSPLQHEAVINIGNLPLNISSAALGTTNFVFEENTCAGSTLAPGVSCVTMMQFSPQNSGTLGDTLIFTDDALNASAATQQVQLSGIGNQVQANTITAASSVSIPFYSPASTNVTLTASVASPAGTVNEGTVTFTISTLGLTALAPVVNGTATATVSVPATLPGVFGITASYTGTGNFASSADASQSLTISLAGSTTTLVSSLNPAAFGQPVTLTATVMDYWGGAPRLGSVTFFDGATNLGTVVQSGGQATLAVVVGSLATGTHSLTAQYSGSAALAASTSAVLTETMNPGVSSQSVVPALAGQSTSSTLTYSFSNLPAAPNFAMAYGLEFTAVPTCWGTGTITCSVSVAFTPLYPGLRQDAVVIRDGSGNVLQTTLLSGVGLAPRAVLVPDLISTYAGGGSGCPAQTDSVGDGCTASSAEFNFPVGIAFDPAGNLYIGDARNNYVRKVAASTGVITAVAGNGTAVNSGDGGAAASAGLNDPGSLALDAAGNLYISERSSNLVRVVKAATGVITTVAGGGVPVAGVGIICGAGQTDSIGDGCAATSAQLNLPSGLAVDTAGNLYISDLGNHSVRLVSAATGVITTYAGGGSGCPQQTDSIGDGCAATSAQLSLPYGLGFDTAGNLYIADASGLIRVVNVATNVISTVLQSAVFSGSGPTGAPTSTLLQSPHGVAVDAAGNVFITDEGTQHVIKFAANGIFTTAGNGTPGYSGDGGPGASAQLYDPSSVALDTASNLYIADVSNNVIRMVGNSGMPLTFAQTNVGSGSATQMVTIANTGNTPLTFTGFRPSANFTIDSTTTTCSTASPLAVSHSCGVGVIFAPTTSGPLNGTLTITDNALNQSAATQTVQLSGVGNAVVQPTTVAAQSVSQIFSFLAYSQTLTATVSAGTGVVNEGTVSFMVGGLNLSAVASVVNGVAAASVAIPTDTYPGVFPITAVFSGAANYGGSTDTSQSLTIVPVSSATALSVTPNPARYAQPVILTATVTNPAGFAANGSVSFYDGSTMLGTATLSGGQASLTVSSVVLGLGSQALTAQYLGNYTHMPSVSPTVNESIITGVSSQNVGTIAVGTSTTQTVTMNFTGLGSLPSFALAYGLEFSLGVPTCSGSVSGMTCTMTLTFQPQYPGVREDEIVVHEGSSVLQQRMLLSGVGQGPRAVLVPDLIGTYAGGGSSCAAQTDSVGDGCTATSAQFNYSAGVAFDPAGNLYIADAHNSYIRKVTASTGVITAVAGNGSVGDVGDGGPAISAQLNNPSRLAVDGAGNLYISERSGNRVRMVNASTGLITTIAGGGTTAVGGVICAAQTDAIGDGCAATSVQLNLPVGLALDPAGNLYIADDNNHSVRMVNVATGIITTFAGSGSGCPAQTDPVGDGCAATSATLMNPMGVAFDGAGNLYIGDTGSGLIRMVSAGTNVISTVLQSASSLSDPTGAPITTLLQNPNNLAVDAAGDVFITDQTAQRVLKFELSTGRIFGEAGNGTAGSTGDGGPATSAQLNTPTSVALDTAGNVYISDMLNNSIRMVGNSGMPLVFAQTNVGSNSVTQMAHIANTGNAPLSFTAFTPGANFTIDPTTTNCSVSAPLAVGASCAVGVIFAPTTGGVLNGTMTITDNSLNSGVASQQVQLAGVGYAPPTLASISVVPTNTSILVGGSQQFTATGQYSDGSTQDLSSIASWTSSNVNIASVGSSGSASGIAAGSTTISASFDSVTGSTSLTVNNTPTGGNVVVTPVDHTTGAVVASFTFSNISKPGTTSVVTSTTAPPTPAGFSVGTSATPTFYNLSTTAVFTGPIQICINYGAASYSNTSQLHLFHFENGAWKDVTTSLNVATSTVCGSVTSLSPFAVLQALTANAPTFPLAAWNTYSTPQNVSLADASPGVTIYYTKDGTTPTTSSQQYTVPIAVSTTTTIKAIAAGGGYGTSPVASATYTFTAAAPTFPLAAWNTYSTPQNVSVADASPGVTIYYTTDGTTPTTSSEQYTVPIAVSTTATIKAIAVGGGYGTSPVASATYTFTAAAPTFPLAAWNTYSTPQNVSVADASPGVTIYYTTDGSTPTTSSKPYTVAIAVSTTTTIKAIASGGGYGASPVASATYTFTAAAPTFPLAAWNTYSTPQNVSLADASPGVTIYYTKDGTTPTTSSQQYTVPIAVSTTTTIKAIAAGGGYGASPVGSATYTFTAAAPTFPLAAWNTYSTPQNVSVADASPGVTIYYTTDGSTPTTSSKPYTVAIAISNTTTIKAIAVGGGYGTSSVASATYTFTSH